MKKWKCTVCGYVHTGDAPPDKCPVCGADKSKFVELVDEAPAAAEDVPSVAAGADGAGEKPAAAQPSVFERLTDQMMALHAHPIAVHIPNGVLPVSVVFLILSVVFGWDILGRVAFYNLLVVALSMPLVLFSGYVDWRKRFNGHLTAYFKIKIGCGVVVLVLSVVDVIWMAAEAGVPNVPAACRVLFLLVNLVMLAAAATAGYFGGKLVFGEK